MLYEREAEVSAKEFAAQLKKTIEEIKAKGTATINCDNLIAYLDEAIKSPSPVVSPAKLEKYKAELQGWVEQNKAAHESGLEMFRSVIQSGQNAIRSSFLLNGGAAVAMLAFIGKLTENQAAKIPAFAPSLTIFVIGVLAITVTSGITYLCQWFYAGNQQWKVKTGFWLNIAAIVLGLSSYGIFIWGMCEAYAAFINFR
ncbi:MAG: hypothetical protein LLF28_05650 [Nitrospiraceae bacterium]|nr:hypothetical protein [Nitrospiraceae bacterium]